MKRCRQQPPTRRRGARGGRGRGSRASARTDEEELSGFYIDNELLIHLVEERVPLWYHTDRRHADHHLTRSLWMEICGKILPDWDYLSAGQQEDCKMAVMVRWRSIRDRYKKDYNEEVNRPSGSGGTRRQPYRYAAALGFLRRTLELRRTTSSTRRQNLLVKVIKRRSLLSCHPRIPLHLVQHLVRIQIILYWCPLVTQQWPLWRHFLRR
ncbi:uncharacterized protein LOC122920312 [Bufo gargarizans]|uniref:uncharacterized protein LOC122920312 n=1 Tax=Bufo gargarizans TaxID=30331 RepID=UPI001CF1422A|nr:uncharacterized protein LOC122920312 [Bufo gargarizans]